MRKEYGLKGTFVYLQDQLSDSLMMIEMDLVHFLSEINLFKK